jgi:transcriptional regulator with XRE-family HTH domain
MPRTLPTRPEVGPKFRKRRQELGLSQVELGRLVGVDQRQISRWELGETYPEGENLERLLAALRRTQRWLAA